MHKIRLLLDVCVPVQEINKKCKTFLLLLILFFVLSIRAGVK